MPRLHPEHYRHARARDGYEGWLDIAVKATDLHGVQNALYHKPSVTHYRDAGAWLEMAAATNYEDFTDRYLDISPKPPLPPLKRRFFNYLAAPPEEWKFRRENLRIIDALVKKGTDPLYPYAADDFPPDQTPLSAADYVFYMTPKKSACDPNLIGKGQVVLHALNADPTFRPHLDAMSSMIERDSSRREAEYARMCLTDHVSMLGRHVGLRLMTPTTPLEQQVSEKLGVRERAFWRHELPEWEGPARISPASASASRRSGHQP